MKTTYERNAISNLERVIAAARGIPTAALDLPVQDKEINPALRFQRMAQLVKFWHQNTRQTAEH